jgi:hypothetical protein
MSPADPPDRDPILAPISIISGVVGFIVMLPVMYLYAFVAALVAAAGGVLVGAPALWMVRRIGVRGIVATTALGLVVGPVPLMLVKAVTGVSPSNWSRPELGFAAVIGAATGAIYATVYDTVNLPPGAVRMRTMVILTLAVIAAFIVLRFA